MKAFAGGLAVGSYLSEARGIGLAIMLGITSICCAQRHDGPTREFEILSKGALFSTPVGGLERTNSTSKVVDLKDSKFSRALRVTIGSNASETNATQLTLPIEKPVNKGDVLFAKFWFRGHATGTPGPAQIQFLFERTVDPWTKSVTQGAVSFKDPTQWRQVLVAFQSAETYQPGEAMVSLRFAFQPQTVEMGLLSVMDYGTSIPLDQFKDLAASMNQAGVVHAKVNLTQTRQTMLGLGGDFCQPRYGSTEPMDAVGNYVLSHLQVAHARVGFPMNYWNPSLDVFKDEAQAHAAFLALQDLAKRHIPLVLTVWEGPTWMLGGSAEQSGRELDPARYDACITAIVKFLVRARDTYHVSVDYFSFNEPDYGVNFKFNPTTMRNFIRRAGPKLAAEGLKTKFLVGDTGGGASLHDFAEPILADASIAKYLGPISFHCWDSLDATEASYVSIAKLGVTFGKPIWCLEAGHDSGAWQNPSVFAKWDDALRTALAYERTLRLSGATVMDYWTYQDNYPIVDNATSKPYPVFSVIQQMERVFGPGSRIATCDVDRDDVRVLPTVGPTRKTFALLVVNPVGIGSLVLSGLPAGANVRLSLSDNLGQDRDLGSKTVDAAGSLTVGLASRSMLTVMSE